MTAYQVSVWSNGCMSQLSAVALLAAAQLELHMHLPCCCLDPGKAPPDVPLAVQPDRLSTISAAQLHPRLKFESPCGIYLELISRAPICMLLWAVG